MRRRREKQGLNADGEPLGANPYPSVGYQNAKLPDEQPRLCVNRETEPPSKKRGEPKNWRLTLPTSLMSRKRSSARRGCWADTHVFIAIAVHTCDVDIRAVKRPTDGRQDMTGGSKRMTSHAQQERNSGAGRV